MFVKHNVGNQDMGSTQMYSLTWGEFGTSLVSAVQLLRCQGDLVDVTLAAGGRSFPAHKIVLCAASPFLLNLLKSTPCQHPVVMLAGVTAQDLEALLEFVYRGEVSVDPNQLPSLLQAAHCLSIQGLAPGPTNSEKNEDLSGIPHAHESLAREVINSFLPVRRRKRGKRRNSTGSGSGSGSGSSPPKWAHRDSTSGDTETRSMDSHNDNLIKADQEPLNMTEVNHKSEDLDSNNHSADESVSGHLMTQTKIRGASDQPGACPLCGALLRQARNLRRHLLTSCKYRMMSPAAAIASLPPASILEPEVQLQQPVGVPLQQPGSPLRTLPLQIQQPNSPMRTIPVQLQRPGSPLRTIPVQIQEPLSPSNPLRAVMLHMHHPVVAAHNAMIPLQLQTDENEESKALLRKDKRNEDICEQIVCKVSPLPSPMSSCGNLTSPNCGIISPTPSMAQQ